MPVLQSVHDLTNLRETARRELARREQTGTVIAVGMGTCGMAAGARETFAALEESLAKHRLTAQLISVGCIGICAREPLVEIRQGGASRVLYGNITADMVERLIQEHLLAGRAVREWVVGKITQGA